MGTQSPGSIFCSIEQHVILPDGTCSCGLYLLKKGRLTRAHKNPVYYFFLEDDDGADFTDLPLFQGLSGDD